MKWKVFSLFILLAFTYNIGAQVKSDYYKDSKIIFCEDVVNGDPVNASTFFIIGSNGGYVTIMINNGKPIQTDKLIVNVWKASGNDNYEEFIETQKIAINPNMYSPFFKYIFYDAGRYKIVINNKSEEWINTEYLTISK
jgi:hypothetical protein